MSSRQLLSARAKDDVLRLVREVEAKTSAEVVVVVRAASAQYLHLDMLVGNFFAFVWICVFLFHPAPFDDDLVPFEVLAAFTLGTLLSSKVPAVRHLFTQKKWLDDAVERAARAAFVEQGVSRTQGRTGLLVYISLFERRVVLVGDVAIDEANLGETIANAKTNLQTALLAKDSLVATTDALRKLGEALGEALPRSNDDVNELADEVAA